MEQGAKKTAAFRDLAKQFELLKLDTKNQSLTKLYVADNRSFVLFLDSKGRETLRIARIDNLDVVVKGMQEVVSTNPRGVVGVNLLKRLLGSENPMTRSDAAEFTSTLKSGGLKLQPELTAMLNNPREGKLAAAAAARALGRFLSAKEAWPILLSVVNDKTRRGTLRGLCVEQLAKLDAKKAQPIIVKNFDTRDYGFRYHLIGAVGALGREVGSLLSSTTAIVLGRATHSMKAQSAVAIGQLKESAEAVLPDLKRLVAQPMPRNPSKKHLREIVERSIKLIEKALDERDQKQAK